MINTNLLKARLALLNISLQDLAKAEGWSLPTAYRKVNGESAFTAPEISVCYSYLKLDRPLAEAIFFPSDLSYKTDFAGG